MKGNYLRKKLIPAIAMVSLLFGVCIHRESILASRAEVPEGYTLLYRANQPGGNGDKDDGYDHHAEDEYNWMDVDEDGSHAQKTPLTEVPEGFTPVRTIDDLYGISDDPSGNYILMNDIDLSQTAPGGEWDFGNGWKPVEEFYGTFDGNGYRIMNMTIYGTTDKETFFGLFGTLRGEHVTIRNLGLVNVSIDISNTSGHSRLNIGGIAGGTGEGGWPAISRCFVTGTISSQSAEAGNIGGIVGYSEHVEIRNCYTDVDISAIKGQSAGGINGCYGYMDGYGSSYHSYAAGSISGEFEYINMVGGSYGKESYYLKSGGKDAYAEGLTRAQMEKERCYTGFDFEKVWYMDPVSGCQYPQLRNCPQARVSGFELTTPPSRLEYTMNELQTGQLDLTDGVLTLMYEDGIKVPVGMEAGMISEIYGNKDDKQAPAKVFLSYVNVSDSFDVKITEVPAAGLKLDQTKCQLNRGESIRLTAAIEPASAENSVLTWSTDNGLVATVSGNGIVKGLNGGTATITAATDNGITASCTVTVNVPAKKIKTGVSRLALKKGQKKKVTVVMTPLDTTDTVTWLSSNSNIVKVNNQGIVTAKKPGRTVIMVKTSSGISKKIKVTVNGG